MAHSSFSFLMELYSVCNKNMVLAVSLIVHMSGLWRSFLLHPVCVLREMPSLLKCPGEVFASEQYNCCPPKPFVIYSLD